MRRCVAILFGALGLVALQGCNDGSKWDITVENKSLVPCSFEITMRTDRTSVARLDAVEKGKPFALISGTGEVVVLAIKVTRNGHDMAIHSGAKLGPGKRLTVAVESDGVGHADVVDK